MSKVSIASDVLTALGDEYRDEHGHVLGWESDPRFLVSIVGSADGGAATNERLQDVVLAVREAGARFSHVDEAGRELPDWEAHAGGSYTPNYVSDPVLLADAVAIWTDTKGEFTRLMGEAMVRILAEVLARLDIDTHIAALPAEADLSKARVIEQPEAPDAGSAQAGEQYWYITRFVWTKTTTGKRYQDIDYRRPDGTWTRDRHTAERIPQSELERVNAICRTLDEAPYDESKYGAATGLLLSPDQELDWLPPPHLRDRRGEQT